MTKRFVILTGLSGSGKTQIALRFGEWLGNGKFEIIPVRPDWTGSEAFFGYEDAIQPVVGGRHAWHVPPVLQFVLKAARSPAEPFLLVLDEMNLAHVERYFADALSGMESGTACLPNLRREPDGQWREDPDSSRLSFPTNLFVVGTVNVDETTYMFSPKVLDRANTIEFRVPTSELDPSLVKPVSAAPATGGIPETFLRLTQDDDWRRASGGGASSNLVIPLKQLHEALSQGGFEFGHRVLYEVIRFADLWTASGDPDWRTALDIQMLQKLLPKLHGSRRKLEPVLNVLARFTYDLDLSEGYSHAMTYDPLVADLGAAALPRSLDKIQRMTRSVRTNQFASFIE